MFCVINRRKLICIILAVVICVSAFIVLHVNSKEEEAVQTFALPTANKVVVIDPGHGGVDAGASANGLSEKDINLEIALKLKEYIEESGGTAIMTRNTDTGTYDPNRKDGTSQKQSDLEERKKMSGDYGADAFVSIHMNKFPQTQYKGAQVFYTSKSEESQNLAENIQQSLKEILKDGNTREAKPNDRNVLILKDTKVPSVIVECGFLSNLEEAQLLEQNDYKQKLAWAIYIGIVKSFV